MTPLRDLDPRWTFRSNFPNSWYTGIVFRSPTDRTTRISAEFVNPMVGNRDLRGDEVRCWDDILRHEQASGRFFHRRIGTSFDDLSLEPSIRSGSQHATITHGVVYP